MSYPVLPNQAPFIALQPAENNTEDAFRDLTQIARTGLSHFARRELPTIWSSICSNDTENSSLMTASQFNDQDSRVIRDWARNLDDWLVRYIGICSECL